MEYVRFKLEYPVMSTSQGTYFRIEQTSEVIREAYEMCREGLELRTAALETFNESSKKNSNSVTALLKYFYDI